MSWWWPFGSRAMIKLRHHFFSNIPPIKLKHDFVLIKRTDDPVLKKKIIANGLFIVIRDSVLNTDTILLCHGEMDIHPTLGRFLKWNPLLRTYEHVPTGKPLKHGDVFEKEIFEYIMP